MNILSDWFLIEEMIRYCQAQYKKTWNKDYKTLYELLTVVRNIIKGVNNE